MLGFLFGFNTRLGRLPFVVCTIGLVATLLLLVTAATGTTPSRTNTDILLAQGSNNVFLIGVFIFLVAANFMLQSMRVRDIGWDPVCVMMGWFALMVIDRIIATQHPEWALNYQHTGTMVGALANAALTLALIFWPTGRAGEEDDESAYAAPSAEGTWRKSTAPAATNRIARVASGEFGGKTR
jgi:uncharacterized membrane protein YhaH (DUF805 family)